MPTVFTYFCFCFCMTYTIFTFCLTGMHTQSVTLQLTFLFETLATFFTLYMTFMCTFKVAIFENTFPQTVQETLSSCFSNKSCISLPFEVLSIICFTKTSTNCLTNLFNFLSCYLLGLWFLWFFWLAPICLA